MSQHNTFVEFHVLRSFPPSNLNRDDLGSPKTSVFGDVRRLRISSQCLKRTWRTSSDFMGTFAEDSLGIRTAQLPSEVMARVGELETAERQAMLELLGLIGRKNAKKEKATDDEGEAEADAASTPSETTATTETAHLLFISRQEVETVVQFARDHRESLAKLTKTAAKPARAKVLDNLRKDFTNYLNEKTTRNAVDVGLFGRFITSDEFDTVDGALCVAHALGTQKCEVEYDFFSAVDDLGTTSGAGHIGETEFASSVMYLYACCDLRQLQANLGERAGSRRIVDATSRQLSAKALSAVAHAMARATPTGKRTGTAPFTPAEHVEVVVRRGQPMSLANAFTRPVHARDYRGGEPFDAYDASVDKFVAHRDRIEAGYARPGEVVGRFVFSLRRPEAGSHASIASLATALEQQLSEVTA